MELHERKWAYILILFSVFSYILASEGDRSPFYLNCVKNCRRANCTEDGWSYTAQSVKNLESTLIHLFTWNCLDECRYECMWSTVEGFKARGYQIPKFHGKWPFRRILGVQEPASALCSLLNLATHVYMHLEINRLFPKEVIPIVLFWHFFAAVCMNAWIWSIIFHMRDNSITEFMDYACALSMVMILYVAAIVRVLNTHRKTAAIIVLVSLAHYIEHVHYLYTDNVDYDYNMMVNVFFGVVGSLIWVLWGCVQYVMGRHYVLRLIAFTLLSGAALALELLDFPPYYDTWDAHALWHLSTVPLPVLFYKFVIDDLRYTQKVLQGNKNDFKLA